MKVWPWELTGELFVSIRWCISVFQMLLNEKAAALQEEVDDLLMIPLDLPQQLSWPHLFLTAFIMFVNLFQIYLIKIMKKNPLEWRFYYISINTLLLFFYVTWKLTSLTRATCPVTSDSGRIRRTWEIMCVRKNTILIVFFPLLLTCCNYFSPSRSMNTSLHRF